MLNGASLYDAACASCHGRDGRGSPDGVFPSLRVVDSLRAPDAANLVHVIADGVDRQVGSGHHYVMPGFGDTMSHAQIAALSNYAATMFAGVEADLDASDVDAILSGKRGMPVLLRYATPLTYALLAGGAALLVFGAARLWRRRKTRAR